MGTKNNNWATARIGDLTYHPQYGWTTIAKKSTDGLKLLRTTDISGGSVNWNSVPVCTQEPEDIEKYLLKDEDILVSRVGSVGLSYLINKPPPSVFASYLIRFQAKKNKIRSKLLYYFFQSPQYWSAIGIDKLGIAVPNVNATKLSDIEVSYPVSLGEQDKLSSNLDYLLPKVNYHKEKISKARKLLQKFRQSVLFAAVTGKLTEEWRIENPQKTVDFQSRSKFEGDYNLFDIPEGWLLLNLGEIVNVGSSKRIYASEYVKTGIPFYRSKEIGELSKFGKTEVTFSISNEKYDELKKRFGVPQKGDILLTSVGTIGNAWVVDGREFYYKDGNITQLRANKHVNTEFLINYLNSPLPCVDEQLEINKKVKSLFDVADRVEAQIGKAELKIEKLTQSILAKAFRGELVN
jgi:type I restriction enzyme S subunit